VHADQINSLIAPDGNTDEAGHAFVETKNKVFDTTAGLMFDKDFYYELEEPKISQKFSKEQLMEQTLLKETIANDTENGKSGFMLMDSMIKTILQRTTENSTLYYKPYIIRELNAHKKGINYDKFVLEERENMYLAQHDPKKLDEKLGIVRDEYGAEMSRNGIPDPYYRPTRKENLLSLDELSKCRAELGDYILPDFNEIDYDAIEQSFLDEFRRTAVNAEKRLSKIAINPTAFAYEIDGVK
jgi:hypothetical protein